MRLCIDQIPGMHGFGWHGDEVIADARYRLFSDLGDNDDVVPNRDVNI
jgi:hypothetical protein